MQRVTMIRPLLVLLVGILAFPVRGQTTLDSYLTHIAGYRFELSETVSDRDSDQVPELFGPDVLHELVLQSFTRGRLVPESEAGSPTLELEVYELLDHQGAFGAFSAFHASQGGELVAALKNRGVDAVASKSRMALWRGRFFLLLTGPQQASLSSAAAALAVAFHETNLYPSSVSQLPDDNLIQGSIRYYLGETSLRTNPVFPAPLLSSAGFDKGVEVAAANYRPYGNALFVLAYPTPALADRHFPEIQEKLQVLDLGVQTKKTGVLVCLFFGSPEEAQRVLEGIRYEPRIQWLYKKPVTPEELAEDRREVADFLGVVVYTLVFSGLALLALIIGGLFFGTVRYRLLRNFPGFRRRSDMIRLNLDDLNEKE